MAQIVALFVCVFGHVTVRAETLPVLVKDIEVALNWAGSDPSDFTVVGNTLFFTATDVTHGRELWKSDGTSGGTVLVKEITPGGSGYGPRNLTACNNMLYFAADDGVNGTELWKSDGTAAGTVMVKDICAGGDSCYPTDLTVVGSTLFFSGYDGAGGYELWKSDGTGAGTMRVKDIRLGSAGSEARNLVAAGSILYFTATDGTTGYELWKSDGTEEGTMLVRDVRPGEEGSDPDKLTAVGGTLFFTADDGVCGRELWKSVGSAEGAVLIKDISLGAIGSGPASLAAIGDTLYFSASDGAVGVEIWKSDGTPDGTVLLKDIYAGPEHSFPHSFTAVGNLVYFSATDGATGTDLWKSDGTPSGTELVKDIATGFWNPGPYNHAAAGNRLYFSVGHQVWKSDGTSAGTVLVKDLFPGLSQLSISCFTVIGDTLYFRGEDGKSGYELWKSDGTAAGTVLVKDINGGTGESKPSDLTEMSGLLYFLTPDHYVSGFWKSDGTSEGTVLIKEIVRGPDSGDQSISINVAGETIYFPAYDSVTGKELWKSDGTTAGTQLVKDIAPGTADANPRRFKAVGDSLYFVANDGTCGAELWKSDGTAAGTMLVKDIRLGSEGSDPQGLTSIGNTLYFLANDGVTGIELWKSDGTADGTVLVKDVVPSGGVSSQHLTAVGDVLFFAIFTVDPWGAHSELWKSDGTAAGTMQVKRFEAFDSAFLDNFTAVGNNLYFSAPLRGPGVELWKSDGTTNGTVMVKDLVADDPFYAPTHFTAVGDSLYFLSTEPATGTELWKTDGTASGTLIVKDIRPGSESSFPRALKAVGGLVYFSAENGTSGHELWRSDGTEAGTVLIKDITDDSGGSEPENFCTVGLKLFFSAQTEQTGRELFVRSINKNPLVTLTGANPWVIDASAAYTDPGAAATDSEDGMLVPVISSSNLAPNVPGVYEVTWTATDSHGETGTATREVRVQDMTAPVISGEFSPLVVIAGTSLPDYTGQASASDLVGVTSITQSPLPGTVTSVGMLDVAITANDGANNSSVVIFSLTVIPPPDFHLFRIKDGDVPNAGTNSDIPQGALWTDVGPPAINNAGQIAYLGKWAAPAFSNPLQNPPFVGKGVFVDDTLVVRDGKLVPGAGTGSLPANATFKSFRDPVIDDGGHVAFLATITGTGVKPTNDTVVVSNGRTGELEVLAREGDQAPGTGGAKFKSFSNVSIQGNSVGGTIFTASLVLSGKNPRITAANDSGAWWLPAGENAVIQLVREGGHGLDEGETIKSFSLLNAVSGSPGQGRGQINGDSALIRLTLSGGSFPRQAQAMAEPHEVTVPIGPVTLVNLTSVGTLTMTVTRLTEIAATGGLLNSATLPAAWKTMNMLSFGNQGQDLAVQGSLFVGVGGVSNADAKGIFASDDSGATWEPVARVGHDTPPEFGDHARFSAFYDPVNSRTDSSIAFVATAKGGLVRGKDNEALWWKPEGDRLQLVAREGDETPNQDSKWKSFASVALPGDGAGPIFTAYLQRGDNSSRITSRDDFALYAMDSFGITHELVRENRPLCGKTVKTFNVLKAESGTAGVTRSFNDNHQVAVHVTFTDGTTGIVKIEIP